MTDPVVIIPHQEEIKIFVGEGSVTISGPDDAICVAVENIQRLVNALQDVLAVKI